METSDRTAKIDVIRRHIEDRVVPESPVIENLSDIPYNRALPVYAHRNEILSSVECSRITLICSQPGSGKSTQIPQYILDESLRNGQPVNIVITQPRRIAAIGVAKWVARQRRQPLGQICGYQVSLDKEVCPSTRLLYCTTGILLQKLIQTKSLDEYTHVILDEAHDRTKEMDFLFLLVKQFLNTINPMTKVIIMSATLQIDEIASYFTSITTRPHIINLTEHLFDVNVFYADDFNLPVLKYINSADHSRDLNFQDQRVESFMSASSVIEALKLIETWDAAEYQTNPRAFVRGTVLVFVPGMGEIIEVENQINRNFPDSCRFTVLPLHSEIAISDQVTVFEQNDPLERRIIVATNIAESSITVPDVRYIIDCCMTKQLVCDPSTSLSSLQLTWASKSSCQQRKGRAGRVANGVCIRLVSRQFYETLPQSELPEMLRTPLLNIILQTKLLDLGSPWEVLRNVISPPEKQRVFSNILTLFELGALAISPELSGQMTFTDGDLTFVGQLMARLPISVHLSKLIAIGHALGLLDDVVIMAAVSSSRQIFPTGYKNMVRRTRNKRRWANGSNSEMFAMVNVFKCYLAYKSENLLRSRESMFRFTAQNGVSVRSLLEAETLYIDLKRRLSMLRIRPFKDDLLREFVEAHKTDDLRQNIDQLLLKVAIAGSCYPNYFVRQPIDEQAVNRGMKLYDPQSSLKVDRVSLVVKERVAASLQKTLNQDFEMPRANVILDPNDRALYIVSDEVDSGGFGSTPDGGAMMMVDSSIAYLSDPLLHSKVSEDIVVLASIDRLTIRPSSESGVVNIRASHRDGYMATMVKVLRFGRFLARADGDFDAFEYRIGAISPTDDVCCQDFENLIPADKRIFIEPVVDDHELLASMRGDGAQLVEVYFDRDRRSGKLSDILIEMYPGVENQQYHSQRTIQIGPFRSNLRSRLVGLARALDSSSEIRIHRSDVNGNMLDCDCQVDFDRLIVASETRSNGNSIILFNTTELPPIVGLPLMMALVFSPVCQVRIDYFQTMYINALCGLGACPANRSVHPDHDIAIHFDTMLNEVDLAIINKIRSYFNLCLYRKHYFDPLEDPASSTMQIFEDACIPLRKLFISLLMKRNHTPYLPQGIPASAFQWTNNQANDRTNDDDDDQSYKFKLYGPIDIPPKDTCPLSNREYVVHLMQQCREMKERMNSTKSCPAIFCEMCWIRLKNKVEITKHVRSDIHEENYRKLTQKAYKKS